MTGRRTDVPAGAPTRRDPTDDTGADRRRCRVPGDRGALGPGSPRVGWSRSPAVDVARRTGALRMVGRRRRMCGVGQVAGRGSRLSHLCRSSGRGKRFDAAPAGVGSAHARADRFLDVPAHARRAPGRAALAEMRLTPAAGGREPHRPHRMGDGEPRSRLDRGTGPRGSLEPRAFGASAARPPAEPGRHAAYGVSPTATRSAAVVHGRDLRKRLPRPPPRMKGSRRRP